MAAKRRIFVSQKQSCEQNLKKNNTFPEQFFNKIWLKVGEHKYILK